MDSLNIAGKAVRLCIDNDESRVIEFYPTDVSFAENFYALAAEFEERQNDIKARSAAIAEGDGSKLEKSRAELALTREAFAFLREGIDRTFGPGTAQTVFGSRDSVAMAARFFRGVTPYIRKARQVEGNAVHNDFRRIFHGRFRVLKHKFVAETRVNGLFAVVPRFSRHDCGNVRRVLSRFQGIGVHDRLLDDL